MYNMSLIIEFLTVDVKRTASQCEDPCSQVDAKYQSALLIFVYLIRYASVLDQTRCVLAFNQKNPIVVRVRYRPVQEVAKWLRILSCAWIV